MSTQQIIDTLNLTIGGFTSKVDAKVTSVNKASAEIRATADRTLGEINKFKTEMIENEQMQSAHENVIRIDQMMREQFSDHDVIRKTVMGVVKDFDINLVRNKTISELSEELWITSSRYWLSYTLIAISAWINDNKTLADNAISESYRTDQAKTALFFCLTNLRFDRTDVAREWLKVYFSTIVPENMQDETAVLLQSYINGVFGTDKALEDEVQSVIDEWIKQINLDDNISKELVDSYMGYISKINCTSTFEFTYLQKYCTNFNELPGPFVQAGKYDKMIAFIKSIDVENIVQNASNYKKRIDSILLDLISNYDKEELELKNEQEYFNLVMENKGKVEIAQQQYDEMMKIKNAQQNVGQKFVEWALYSKDIDVHVRKFGVQNTRGWFLTALRDWSSEFEASFPTEYKIAIDNWSCVSNGEDQIEQTNSLKEYLEKNKFKIKYVNKFNIVLIVLTIIFAALCTAAFILKIGAPIVPFVLLGVSCLWLIILIVRILIAGSRFKKKVNATLEKINGVFSELTMYRKKYFENKDKKAELFSLIEHL